MTPFNRAADPRGYVRCAATTCAVLLSAVALSVGLTDPYMLWRSGRDVRRPASDPMQMSKSLQSIARNPDLVFLGSSRTLMGLDPARLPEVRAYNLGTNGPVIADLEGLTRHVLRWTNVKTLVVGVDYFMFDADAVSYSGVAAEQVGTLPFLVESLGTCFFSQRALKDTRIAWGLSRRGALPDWRPDGMMDAHPLSAERIDDELANLASHAPSRLTADRFACLDRMLTACDRKGVRVILFVPPLHERRLNVEMARDGAAGYEQFRAKIGRIASRHGLPLHDFAQANAITTVLLTDSNDLYIDTSHFTPRVGALVMARLGLPVELEAVEQPLLTQFGGEKPFAGLRVVEQPVTGTGHQ